MSKYFLTNELYVEKKIFDVVKNLVEKIYLHSPDLNNDENWEKYCKSVEDHRRNSFYPNFDEQMEMPSKEDDCKRILLHRLTCIQNDVKIEREKTE